MLSENTKLHHLGHPQSLLTSRFWQEKKILPCWCELNDIEYSQQQCGLKEASVVWDPNCYLAYRFSDETTSYVTRRRRR